MKNRVLNTSLFLLFVTLPILNYAQAPNLGRVASFALFTSVGAFNNYGTSAIIGDIGTNAGAFTGFPPGTLIGTIHIADSVSTLAATNLATAAASLSALTCGSPLASGLGYGQTLTPNIYCISSLATLNGNLTLNAMGNPNAVFVIKVDGALNTGLSSKVLLTNSANQNNVYWYVNGAFTLGDSSIFRGTLIANGAINLLLKSAILGRGLSTAGAINIYSSNTVLPVKLVSFNASCNKQSIVFNWTTASEKNNRYFMLETSSDKNNWISLAKINGAGTSNSVNKYSYVYANAPVVDSYYRLKQTDIDGACSYSEVIVVGSCQEEKLTVQFYPNPVSGLLNLSYQSGLNQNASVAVYDIFGVRVFQAEGLPSSINLASYANGIYFLHVFGNGKSTIEKIFLQQQ
ncbi:MAG: hypothetical protein CFE21_03435 [Bacteroidetes bacterium B1(2017)]|nr:MAG: hypothetical protein CFE21_03435 [Bacteroidetes bacterium B1(2017)]